MLSEMIEQASDERAMAVLRCLGIATSSWYRRPIAPEDRRRPGPKPKPIPDDVIDAVVNMATTNP